MGISHQSRLVSVGPDTKTGVARQDREEVSQSYVLTLLPNQGCAPTRITAVVQPASLRTASSLPATYALEES
jgi:hypothetical protein